MARASVAAPLVDGVVDVVRVVLGRRAAVIDDVPTLGLPVPLAPDEVLDGVGSDIGLHERRDRVAWLHEEIITSIARPMPYSAGRGPEPATLSTEALLGDGAQPALWFCMPRPAHLANAA